MALRINYGDENSEDNRRIITRANSLVDPIEPEAAPWATPLAWAERRHHAEIASILRQRGADR